MPEDRPRCEEALLTSLFAVGKGGRLTGVSIGVVEVFEKDIEGVLGLMDKAGLLWNDEIVETRLSHEDDDFPAPDSAHSEGNLSCSLLDTNELSALTELCLETGGVEFGKCEISWDILRHKDGFFVLFPNPNSCSVLSAGLRFGASDCDSRREGGLLPEICEASVDRQGRPGPGAFRFLDTGLSIGVCSSYAKASPVAARPTVPRAQSYHPRQQKAIVAELKVRSRRTVAWSVVRPLPRRAVSWKGSVSCRSGKSLLRVYIPCPVSSSLFSWKDKFPRLALSLTTSTSLLTVLARLVHGDLCFSRTSDRTRLVLSTSQ